MSPVYDERTFEGNVVASLLSDGWRAGDPTAYDAELGLDTSQLTEYLGATQGDDFNELADRCGGTEVAQATFLKVLAKRIDERGTLDVLRKGITVEGLAFKLFHPRPSLTLAEDALADYRENRVTVTRQLHYATKDGDRGKSLDLVLFVNGLPVATAELKNPLTGQDVNDAKRQYAHDRDPLEPLFARRALVHFAVDPDLVFLTTRLAGSDTVFLPFNTGSEGPGRTGGAGNPPLPEGASGYRTSYLWERVWQIDNWLDLLERFVHVKRDKDAKGRKRQSVIFPRYHQWHAVRSLVDHAARHGAGNNYLVMHSAGSGKSNTIAWLSHRLESLHTPADPGQMDPAAVAAGLNPNEPVFDKTIIITDRSVLDRQLQDTVGDFSQVEGLVGKIGGKGGSKSAQLAEALSTSTKRVLIVTLQTFPALLDYLKRDPVEIKGRRFAIVVDEAHSSQSGEAAKDVKKALRDLGLDADDDEPDSGQDERSTEDALRESAAYRGRSANLSYFAFTATPKHKTLNLFGIRDEATGKFEPFHVYSMRQAIDEGFILDPLRNYLTYGAQYKIANLNPDDPEVDADKASSELARFAFLHKSSLDQHAELIVENFNRVTRRQMGGRAKAMVVTRSREAALRLYRSIVGYLAATRAPDPGVLVAVSGALQLHKHDPGVTEADVNKFPEGELPGRFAYTAADDRHAGTRPGTREYRLLIVAEKYQTGFDQPLLTTMFVVKPLKGVAAVQTLSRLNRTHPRKNQSDLFVLDFVNKAEDIKEQFKPFYEQAVTAEADPDRLHSARHRLMSEANILVEGDLEGFAEAYLDVTSGPQPSDEQLRNHPDLHRHLDPAVRRFAALARSDDEDDRADADTFRAELNDYVTKYAFLAQIMRYPDAELERLYLYGRFLLRSLPARRDGGVDIGKVDLSHFKLFATGEHDLGLSEGDEELPGFADGAAGPADPKKELLSELIEMFNDHFGRDLSEADRLMFEERMLTAVRNPEVQAAALQNDENAFQHKFDPALENAMVERYESNVEVTDRFFGNSDFRNSVNRAMRKAAYRLIRREHGSSAA
jgi:type I restriction enzyme R subunit